MSRKGNLKTGSGKIREEKSARFLILTDGEKTEKSYFEGLKDYLSQTRVSIGVISKGAKTFQKLLKDVHKACRNKDYALVALVIDKDDIKDFDQKVTNAESIKSYGNDIKVGWSNWCFEVWLSAYFGPLVTGNKPEECIEKFKRIFKKNTGHEYTKNNKDLYPLLRKWGNEDKAIERAEQRMIQHKKNGHLNPSQQLPGTTVHTIVKKIIDESGIKNLKSEDFGK